jgi:hypothetical protein
MLEHFHGTIAVIFFALVSIDIFLITFVIGNLRKIRKDFISKKSWRIKKFLTYFLIIPVKIWFFILSGELKFTTL